MSQDEIRFLGDLHRLEAKPGDRFVLVADHPLSAAQIDSIRTAWAGATPTEFGPLLIIEHGFRLGVISAAGAATMDDAAPTDTDHIRGHA